MEPSEVWFNLVWETTLEDRWVWCPVLLDQDRWIQGWCINLAYRFRVIKRRCVWRLNVLLWTIVETRCVKHPSYRSSLGHREPTSLSVFLYANLTSASPNKGKSQNTDIYKYYRSQQIVVIGRQVLHKETAVHTNHQGQLIYLAFRSDQRCHQSVRAMFSTYSQPSMSPTAFRSVVGTSVGLHKCEEWVIGERWPAWPSLEGFTDLGVWILQVNEQTHFIVRVKCVCCLGKWTTPDFLISWFLDEF